MMSRLLVAVTAALAFAATLAVLSLGGRGATPRPPVADLSFSVTAPGGTTDQRIGRLLALLRLQPREVDGLSTLAGAYLQKVRETADAAYYARAQTALDRALRIAPADPGALTERGALQLSRHDFRDGLHDARRARALAPAVDKPFGVLVDALVELGRYGAAGQALQEMVDRKPDLAAYARVSYFRELHGDLSGAIDAMKLAVSAGGGAAENVAYVQTLLGNLYFAVGRLNDARDAYGTALESFPGYVPATAGLASVSPVRRALRLYKSAVARLPLPQYVVALGELQQAAGKRPDYDLVRAEERLLQANGVNTDVDLALFEANHGSPAVG